MFGRPVMIGNYLAATLNLHPQERTMSWRCSNVGERAGLKRRDNKCKPRGDKSARSCDRIMSFYRTRGRLPRDLLLRADRYTHGTMLHRRNSRVNAPRADAAKSPRALVFTSITALLFNTSQRTFCTYYTINSPAPPYLACRAAQAIYRITSNKGLETRFNFKMR